MQRLRVLTVVGTRPEIIRLSRVIAAFDHHFDHVLVHTGQNYDDELNRIFFDELEIRAPDHFLKVAGTSAAETIGAVIQRIDPVLAERKPDALLVLGDTNSCLAVIPAKRRKIPIFHMEAGNRCFDQRVPEETNRRVVDHVADINLPYSDIAREHLLREGIPPDRIVKTGSPLCEVLAHYRSRIGSSRVLETLGLPTCGYFLVSAHREENVDEPGRLGLLADILNGLAERHGMPVIVSTHPRTRHRIEAAGIPFHDLVRLSKPFGYFDYVTLQQHALVVLSDSGTITEESSLLGFPALNLRDAHERPEGMEEGTVIMTGLNPLRVEQGLAILGVGVTDELWRPRVVRDYDVPVVSEKVVRVVASYTDFVRRNVWHQPPEH